MSTIQPIDDQYVFDSDWFSHNISALDYIFNELKPTKILEIGSFEGWSTVHFIKKALSLNDSVDIHCIDSWEGGAEHKGKWDMLSVENRFMHNMHLVVIQHPKAVVSKYKGYSHTRMMELLLSGKENYFDFIYVDGSHEAPDVLFDALLAHRLVRVGGIIAFDDYLWSPKPWNEADHYMLVKPAVDHYVNTYQRHVSVLHMLPSYQLYVSKIK